MPRASQAGHGSETGSTMWHVRQGGAPSKDGPPAEGGASAKITSRDLALGRFTPLLRRCRRAVSQQRTMTYGAPQSPPVHAGAALTMRWGR